MFKTSIFLSSLGNILKARYVGASLNSGIDYDFWLVGIVWRRT
jgi:hypothetical protein